MSFKPRSSLIIVTAIVVGLAAALTIVTQSRRDDYIQPKDQRLDRSNLLLPDLQVQPTAEMYIEETEEARLLRFSSSFINVGEGPLELTAENDEENQVSVATQAINQQNGSIYREEIGSFILHPDHDHWHTENFTIFQIWNINENGEAHQLLNQTEKLSFCIWDEEKLDMELENATEDRVYPGCANGDLQGLSVGWSDTYDADTSGQELDISSIENGSYIVRSIINPDENIIESDYTNNATEEIISVIGDEVIQH